MSHKSSEKRNSLMSDNLMLGFLRLVEIILRIRPDLCKNLDNLLDYTFNELLFTKNH